MPAVQFAGEDNTFPVDYGAINFTMHQTPSNPEFVKCRPWADKTKLVEYAWNEWGLEKTPGALIRITGSLEGSQEHYEDVVEGIITAVNICEGWLFSTGLNFGIANLVGTILARNRHICNCPLIGVAAWRTVQAREQLLVDAKGRPAAKGAKRNYADGEPSPDMDKISLQPNHTVRMPALQPCAVTQLSMSSHIASRTPLRSTSCSWVLQMMRQTL